MEYLYCACPVAGCPKKDIDFWFHYGCGGKTMIKFDTIEIVCSKCQSTHLIFEWMFSCGAHKFEIPSLQGCLFALSCMGQQKNGTINQIKKATQLILNKWPPGLD